MRDGQKDTVPVLSAPQGPGSEPSLVATDKRRVRWLIGGQVQGVGYRVGAMRAARDRGIVGWVRNLRSGQVELLAEGSQAALGRLEEWCRWGPRGAEVTSIETLESGPALDDLALFEISDTPEE